MGERMELDNKEDIRNKIIKEASRLFIEQGYTKTTIRQIADVCDLGRGHLYYYFKKKEDIVLYLYKNLIQQIYSFISETKNETIDPRISYAIIQYVYIKVIVTNKDLFRMYIEASETTSVRKEYIKTLKSILNENLKKFNYNFNQRDINLSIIIGSAGEDELLRNFYNDDTSLELDEIIEITIKTRLLLLNINHEEVNKIISECKKEAKTIEINKIIKNVHMLDI
jgi:AcrR family transcriptional regulator